MSLLAFKLAVVSYVYAVILTEPGMFLSWWYKFLLSLNLPEWIFKPLIDCFKCVAGQAAFWGYLIYTDNLMWLPKNYNPFDHLYLICLTILISIIIDKIYSWNSNN